MSKVIINGKLVNDAEAMVSLLDRNIQLGLNAFETMRAVKGKIDGFDLHILRLQKGIERLQLNQLALDTHSILESIRVLLEGNLLDNEDARVRITAMGETLMIQASTTPEPKLTCSTVISDHVLNECSATAGIKCGSYAPNIVALKQADADEVIFLNTRGEVAEAAMANVFLVNDGKLITPSLASGCLPGVTRALVIERARAAGFDVQEASILLEDLFDAEEVFLTNSVMGICRVERIGAVLLEGGNVTQRVRKIYQDGSQ